MPGVVRVLTHKDVPQNVYTILSLIQVGPEDEPVLAVDKVRWKGEPIVAVLADSERAAREAAAKVKVDYEVLPAVFDIEEALKPGAPLVNEYHGQNYFKYEAAIMPQGALSAMSRRLRRRPTTSSRRRYQSSPIEHAPTETTGCIVVPDGNGRFTCYTNTQAMFFTLDNTSLILQCAVPQAAPGRRHGRRRLRRQGRRHRRADRDPRRDADQAGRSNIVYSREEEMQVSSPRAAERIYIKDGVMKDGRIVARKVTALHRCRRLFAPLAPTARRRRAAHMPGPYTIPNVWVDAYCVYTNRTPSSAMRGFGVTIGDFALEVQMDKLARLIGMDPLEFRFINAYRDGDMKAHRRDDARRGADRDACRRRRELANWPVGGELSWRCRPRRREA